MVAKFIAGLFLVSIPFAVLFAISFPRRSWWARAQSGRRWSDDGDAGSGRY